jgi:hypothetical protein
MKKSILNILPYLIIFLGIVFALLLIDSARQTTRENNFYTRFQVCVLTISPLVRNEQSVNSCYDQVEKQTGIKADRYKVQDPKEN